MNEVVNLILSEEPVHRLQLGGRPITRPGVAVVCTTADGHLERVGRLGMMTRYRLRYEVDVADHNNTIRFPLPTKHDVHEFQGTFVLGWRVTDPVEVVSRRVTDGLDLCHSRLLDHMPLISRDFDIQDCAKAEREINRALGGGSFVLPEGITVYHFSARLTLDDSARVYQQARVAAGREADLEQIGWCGDLDRARHDEKVAGVRRDAIRQALKGDNDLLIYHLAQDPGASGAIIDMIRTDRSSTEQQRITLLKELIDRNMIQDVDLDELRSALLSETAQGLRRSTNSPSELPSIIQQEPISIVAITESPEPATGTTSSQGAPGDHATAAMANSAPDDGSGVVSWKQRGPKQDGAGSA